MSFEQKIEQAINVRKHTGLYRPSRCFERIDKQYIQTQNHTKLLNFSSNDYLGLACDTELIAAWQQGLSIYGCGSSASPAITGISAAHTNLQAKLTEWLGYECAVLFNSGFSANQALLFSLLEHRDVVIQDKLNHASLQEAGMLSPANLLRFKHNDGDDLARKLKNIDTQGNKLVVSEGVFSMDGDLAPINTLNKLSTKHQAWLAIDDAHGIGVLGQSGGGITELTGIKPHILVVTFGKALGIGGAAILCDQNTADYLTQFARHYVYSTAMPPAQAYAISHAVEMTQTQHWRRQKLNELSLQLLEQLDGFDYLVKTQTSIKPWLCGSSQYAIELSQYLQQQGLWVSAIRPPTVPANSARLRITLTASHTPNEVIQLAKALQRFYRNLGDGSKVNADQLEDRCDSNL